MTIIFIINYIYISIEKYICSNILNFRNNLYGGIVESNFITKPLSNTSLLVIHWKGML